MNSNQHNSKPNLSTWIIWSISLPFSSRRNGAYIARRERQGTKAMLVVLIVVGLVEKSWYVDLLKPRGIGVWKDIELIACDFILPIGATLQRASSLVALSPN